MNMACSDCSSGCACLVTGGVGTTVSGSGTASDPYVIDSTGPVSPDWQPALVATWNAATVSLAALDEPTTIEVTLSANVTTLTLPTWAASVSGELNIIITNTGSFTVTWPGLKPGGAAITNTASGVDLMRLTWTGTRWITLRIGTALA